MRALGLGNMTAFFRLTYYAYHDGAMREAKITKVVSKFKDSRTTLISTRPTNIAEVDGVFKFYFKMAGVKGIWTNQYISLDPLREKQIDADQVALLAITDWLGKPQLLTDSQRWHIGEEVFQYNTIENGRFVIRKGFVNGVTATPDDVMVDILTANYGEKEPSHYTYYKDIKNNLTTIRMSDKESVKAFTMTKDEVLAELSSQIVRFSDEEKRAEEEKLNNIIGSLHAGIQSLVNDYAEKYPVSITIRVAGRIDNV